MNRVYYNEPALNEFAEANNLKPIISSDRVLSLVKEGFTPLESPSKPSYVVEPMPNWPLVNETESNQLLAYAASSYGAGDGYGRSRSKNTKTLFEETFFEGPDNYDDYLQWRWILRDNLSGDWNTMSDFERAVCIELDLMQMNSTEKVVWQMTKGMSQGFAVNRLLNFGAENHINMVPSCTERGKDPFFFKLIFTYLSPSDASLLLSIVKNLYNNFMDQAIFGTNDGNAGAGIFDYFEGTDIYVDAGLADEGFIMRTADPGDAAAQEAATTQFITRMMTWLRYRIKT